MFKYFISFCLILTSLSNFGQEKQVIDSVSNKTAYGLRLGIDISKPIMGMIDSNSSGIEFVADYRISKNWYIATEFGAQEEITVEDYTNSTSKGSFYKIGINYNAYDNWLDMNNEIFVGFRYATSAFEQTLNSYKSNTGSDYFAGNIISTPLTTKGLNAHWTEFVLGIKVETFKNLFLGFSFSYKIMLSLEHPTNFKTLYVPGFNRVFDTETGFGFNYTISYTIPFISK
ncbi:DUF6048 family protein [Polaribacter uvawellassae]|uniref:DUF6048 family protein n=1 Tax=Polaribacter uvawellassae TaxID=3133495 RepID=UPI00321A8D16